MIMINPDYFNNPDFFVYLFVNSHYENKDT